jgi:hypothetical protein
MWSAGSCRGWIKEASVSEAATRVYESSILHEYQQTAVAAIKTANAVAKKKSDGEDVKLLAWKVYTILLVECRRLAMRWTDGWRV